MKTIHNGIIFLNIIEILLYKEVPTLLRSQDLLM